MRLHRLLFLTSTTICSSLLAQNAEPAGPDVAAAVAEAHGFARQGDTVVGLAGPLQATFDAGGVTFVPALGRAAPHNATLRLAPQSVLRSGHADTLSQRQLAMQGDLRTDFDLGDGVTERYDARPDGFKQSFLFAERPAGTGDLTVRLSVETNMQSDVKERGQGLHFRFGPLGGVHVGKVVGIDADGRRADGFLSYDGQSLDLTLPGAFVDKASYPLELDPVIGGALTTGIASTAAEPDIAYDSSQDRYVVVFERRFSANDTDIWLRPILVDGTILPLQVVTQTLDDSRRPRIANDRPSQQFCVVWEENSGPFGNWIIKGRMLSSLGTPGVEFVIGQSLADSTTPDIGGNGRGGLFADRRFVCVWDDAGLGITSRAITPATFATSAPTLGSTSLISGGGDPLRARPVITKTGGDAERWFVAYEQSAILNTSISVVAVDATGSTVSTLPGVVGGGTMLAHVDIAGDGDRFAMVYERQDLPNPRAIYMARGEFVPTGSLVLITGAPNQVSANQAEETRPKIARTRSRYVATWRDAFSGGVRVVPFDLDGGSCSGEIVNAPAFQLETPAICSQFASGGLTSEKALLSYERVNQLNGERFVDSRLYEYGGGSVTGVPGAGGCGVGGTCSANGPFSLGNGDFAFELSGSSQTALLALLILEFGAPTTNPFCGAACTFITQDLGLLAPMSIGTASVAFPVPCQPSLLFFEMGVQFAPLSSAPGGCTIVPQLHLSNALHLRIVD